MPVGYYVIFIALFSIRAQLQLSRYGRTDCTGTYITYTQLCTIVAGSVVAKIQNQKWF
jgi:hypothetical protein